MLDCQPRGSMFKSRPRYTISVRFSRSLGLLSQTWMSTGWLGSSTSGWNLKYGHTSIVDWSWSAISPEFRLKTISESDVVQTNSFHMDITYAHPWHHKLGAYMGEEYAMHIIPIRSNNQCNDWPMLSTKMMLVWYSMAQARVVHTIRKDMLQVAHHKFWDLTYLNDNVLPGFWLC